MVGQLMHVVAQHVGRIPAQQAGTRPVDENTVSIQVDAKNALTCGIQQQIELVLPQGTRPLVVGEGKG